MKLRVKVAGCSGCGLCALACAYEQAGILQARYGAIRVQEELPESLKVRVRFCIQCRQGYCIEACPREALIRVKDGQVVLAPDRCDSCQGRFPCVPACRFGGLFVHPAGTQPLKCDLCGGEPRCVEVCPEQVIAVG